MMNFISHVMAPPQLRVHSMCSGWGAQRANTLISRSRLRLLNVYIGHSRRWFRQPRHATQSSSFHFRSNGFRVFLIRMFVDEWIIERLLGSVPRSAESTRYFFESLRMLSHEILFGWLYGFSFV